MSDANGITYHIIVVIVDADDASTVDGEKIPIITFENEAALVIDFAFRCFARRF